MSMDKRKFASAIATFVVLFASVNAQRIADVDPRITNVRPGEEVTIICRHPNPIHSCRFRIADERDEFKLNPNWNDRNRNQGFEYVGEGLEKGQCGLKLHRIQESQHGSGACYLDLNDGLPDVVGNFSIIVAKAPNNPEIEIDHPATGVGETMDLRCIVSDGRPAAEIKWYLNDQPLGSGEITEHANINGPVTYLTTVSDFRYKLRAEDDAQNLICRASHPGYENGHMDAKYQLEVFFRPVPMAEIYVDVSNIGGTASLGPITLHSNPQPTIQWTVNGRVIKQGGQNERFSVKNPEAAGRNLWNVSMTIFELTLEDTTQVYLLRASNAQGTTDYKVRIGSAAEAGSSGLGIVSIIAISIISIFVLVVIVLVVVARVTKRWCFAGDSLHPNGPDSEAQIAPDDDKTHEHYEQHEKSADDEPEPETVIIDENGVKATNGKAKGNTSV